LDKTGLATRVSASVISIDAGRKGFATRGKEQEGRILYETGIAEAMTAFNEAQSTTDPYTIILAEYTFLSQELQFCEADDKDSLSSLTRAIQSFDDAFLALGVVEEPRYTAVEKATPHAGKYRVHGFPKDSFHIACAGHRTRLQNILRTPGLDPIEKALLKKRFENLSAAQSGYIEKQRKVLEGAIGLNI